MKKNCDNKNRFDAVIEFNNIPVGFNWFVRYWWKKNLKAEYYIVVGEANLKR